MKMLATFAAALLAMVAMVNPGNAPLAADLQQDTTMRAIQLSWPDQSMAERLIIVGADTARLAYDSVNHQIQIRSPDLIVFDSIFRGDTTYIWAGGTYGQPYYVKGTVCGYLDGEASCKLPTDSLQISYPFPMVIGTTLKPVTITAETVEIQK